MKSSDGRSPEDGKINEAVIVRNLLNDPNGAIFTDEILEPFLVQARSVVPCIAAAMAAYSRNNYQLGDWFLTIAAEMEFWRYRQGSRLAGIVPPAGY